MAASNRFFHLRQLTGPGEPVGVLSEHDGDPDAIKVGREVEQGSLLELEETDLPEFRFGRFPDLAEWTAGLFNHADGGLPEGER